MWRGVAYSSIIVAGLLHEALPEILVLLFSAVLPDGDGGQLERGFEVIECDEVVRVGGIAQLPEAAVDVVVMIEQLDGVKL